MERKRSMGRQKIEMKLIKSKEARYVSFSKRKASLFKKAKELSNLTGAELGVLLFSPSGKTYSYCSTSIEEIINKFLQWKQDESDGDESGYDNVEKLLNVFKAFDDLLDEIEIFNVLENIRRRKYKINHPGSEIPPDKNRLDRLVECKLQLDKLEKMAIRLQEIMPSTSKSVPSTSSKPRLSFDLNVLPELDEGECSGTK